MTHPTRPQARPKLALWLAAIAALGLPGCVAPVPMQQLVAQEPAPVLASTNPHPRDYRRRNNERLYEAKVLSVRAVMGPTEQRCWIEREAVPAQRPAANMPAAVIGGVIGGILGHQIGGGTGQDLATVGGVVAGAAIGANVDRDRTGNPVATQDVRRCSNDALNGEPAYWDVSYQFRGVMHHAQLSSPPERSILVNASGEPRE